MAGLVDTQIRDSYKSVLRVNDNTNGIDSSLEVIEDGEGTDTPLYLSSADVAINDGSGLVIGSTSVQETVSIADGSTDLVPELQVLGTAAADSSLLLGAFSTTATTAGAPNLCFVKGGNATIGAHTVVTDDEELGNIIAFGDDGTDLESPAAMIQFEVDGAPGTGDMPGRIILSTTADGAEVPTERMRISSTGYVGIGAESTLYPLFVSGAVSTWALAVANDGNATSANGISIKCGKDDASGVNYAVGIYDGDGTPVGMITFSGVTVSYGAFTANHDVELPSSDNVDGYPYGTLVEHTEIFYKQKNGSDSERGILYKVQKSSSAYSKSVLGAYAGKYEDKDNLHQVYILGDGHILCCGEKGNIAIGDGICTSSASGIGMKADKLSMIIGIAQEDVSFSGSESKLVVVQYGLQQFTPWE